MMSEKLWSACISTYCICLTRCVTRTLHRSVLEQMAMPSHMVASVLHKVPGIIKMIFMKRM